MYVLVVCKSYAKHTKPCPATSTKPSQLPPSPLIFFCLLFKNLLRLKINILSQVYPEISFPAKLMMKINNLSRPNLPGPPQDQMVVPLRTLVCKLRHYTLQSSLQIELSILLDDWTWRAHHLTPDYLLRGVLSKLLTFRMSFIHCYRIQIHNLLSIYLHYFRSFESVLVLYKVCAPVRTPGV